MLQCFVSFLQHQGLDLPSSLKLVTSKLPSFLQDRCSHAADGILHQEGGSVTFSRLGAFLDHENRIKLNPVFGKTSISVSHADHKSCAVQSQSKKKMTPRPQCLSLSPRLQVPLLVCLRSVFLCPFQHPFKSCNKFRKLLHKETIAFLIKYRMCFGCLAV